MLVLDLQAIAEGLSGVGDVPEESLMLTGDENIVDIDYSVFWVIKDAKNFFSTFKVHLKQ